MENTDIIGKELKKRKCTTSREVLKFTEKRIFSFINITYIHDVDWDNHYMIFYIEINKKEKYNEIGSF